MGGDTGDIPEAFTRLFPDFAISGNDLVPNKNVDMKKSRLWTKSGPLSVIDNSGHDSEAFPKTFFNICHYPNFLNFKFYLKA